MALGSVGVVLGAWLGVLAIYEAVTGDTDPNFATICSAIMTAIEVALLIGLMMALADG